MSFLHPKEVKEISDRWRYREFNEDTRDVCRLLTDVRMTQQREAAADQRVQHGAEREQALRTELAQVYERLAKAEQHIMLAGGYHARTPLELGFRVRAECGGPFSAADMLKVLDLVDAGRNRVYAAEEALRVEQEKHDEAAYNDVLSALLEKEQEQKVLLDDLTGAAWALKQTEGKWALAHKAQECYIDRLRKERNDALTEAEDMKARWARARQDADISLAKRVELEATVAELRQEVELEVAHGRNTAAIINATLATTVSERDRAQNDLDSLVSTLVKLFDWSDTSYLHAAMHVENAVRNLRADLAVARKEADEAVACLTQRNQELRELKTRTRSHAAEDLARRVP